MVHLFYFGVPAQRVFRKNKIVRAVVLLLQSLRLFPFFDKTKKELLASLFVVYKKYEKIVRHFRLRPHANPLATENISYATKTLHSPK
jgi:hypothetical protein